MGDSNEADKLGKVKGEDASSYYAQGEKGEEYDLKGEYGKPLPPVDSVKEEVNLVRTLSYLAFGGAALALVFILFFINKKVDNVGKDMENLAPFKKEVGEHIVKLSAETDKLRAQVEQHEKSTMIMELKRALVTVEGVTANSSPEIKNKSAQAVAGIQSLLDELGAGAGTPPAVPAVAPEAKPAEATAPAVPVVAPETKPAEATAPAVAPEAKPAEAVAPPAPEAKPADAPPATGAPKAGAKKKAASDDDDDDDKDD